jgi:F0F1-type ATP synthase epsilon subunit
LQDGTKAVSYERVSLLLLEAVKMQRLQIQQLETRSQQLETRSKQLEQERDETRGAHSALERRLAAIELAMRR